jgi:hypothetical protein
MSKDELIETIRVKRRQLERYLFYFEKNSDGVFVAGDRPKFGGEEMLQPGVVEDWSLKDVLAHLIDWERRFVRWYQAGWNGEAPDVPALDLDWAEADSGGQDIPPDLRASAISELLTAFKRSYARLLATLEAIPEEDLLTPGRYDWTGDAIVADYAALATYVHYDWAKKHIRHWRKTHAGKHLNKGIILERIQTERRRLQENLATLSDEQTEVAGVVGAWSVKDLLAHLADWEQRFLGWYEAGLRGEVPETPAPGIRWEELDVLNQQIYERHRDRAWEEVWRDFCASYEQVLATVEGIPEEDMFTVGRYAWLGEGNLVGYILANTANHDRWAKDQIRDWLKAQGGPRPGSRSLIAGI